MQVPRKISTALIVCNLFIVSVSHAQVMSTPAVMAKDPSTSASLTTSMLAKLSPQDVEKILSQAEASSSRTVSYAGLRTTPNTKRACRHHIFVVDRNGHILGRRSMPDAWTGSIDVALGKARTAVFFSSDENALSTRQLGQLSQAHGPNGEGGAGPLWGIGDTNRPGGQGVTEVQRNSVVTFPGGLPLYKDGHLVGGVGVSGDNVDQDESVAFGGAQGFMPSPDIGTPTPLKPKPVDWLPAK